MRGLTWLSAILHKKTSLPLVELAENGQRYPWDEFNTDTLQQRRKRQILMSKYPGLGCFYEAGRARRL